MKTELQLQQGDINIVIVSLPDGATKDRKSDSHVIREGSATGHSHRLTGNCDVYRLRWPQRIFAVCRSKCELVHEEHKTIILKPGTYEFIPVSEFDPIT